MCTQDLEEEGEQKQMEKSCPSPGSEHVAEGGAAGARAARADEVEGAGLVSCMG